MYTGQTGNINDRNSVRKNESRQNLLLNEAKMYEHYITTGQPTYQYIWRANWNRRVLEFILFKFCKANNIDETVTIFSLAC